MNPRPAHAPSTATRSDAVGRGWGQGPQEKDRCLFCGVGRISRALGSSGYGVLNSSSSKNKYEILANSLISLSLSSVKRG